MYDMIEYVNEVIGTVLYVMFLISLIVTFMGYGTVMLVYFAAFIVTILLTGMIEFVVVIYNENRNGIIKKETEA
jgi:hypothetical protein